MELFDDTGEVLKALQQLSLRVNSLAGSLTTRQRLTHDGKRNIRNSLGYPENPNFEDFYSFYARNDIAGRIIDLPVDSTWSGEVNILGFKEWPDLNRRLSLTSRFAEADRLAGLGKYSVVLIGVKQEQEAATPEAAARALEKPIERGMLRNLEDILFLRQYAEPAATIDKFYEDPSKENFLTPEFYRFNFGYSAGEEKNLPISVGSTNVKVHSSRVLHLASGRMFGDVYGHARLLRIYDRLFDVEKVVGGSAEMFWQGADRMAVAQIADANAHVTAPQRAEIRAELERLFAGLERMTVLQGGEMNWAPSVQPDPRGIFQVLIALICGAIGIPQRILLGSERGNLASVEDRQNYAELIKARRSNFAWPHVLFQFIKRLDEWGLITESIDQMVPDWPEVEHLTLKEKAEIRKLSADTLAVLAKLDVRDFVGDERALRLAGVPGGMVEENPEDLIIDEAHPDVIEAWKIAQNLLKAA